MKRYIYIAAVLLAVSCEKEVDFPADETGRIYVEAILGKNAGNRINLIVSQPAFGSEDTSAEDIALNLKADGETVAIVRDLDYVPDVEGGISYLVQEGFQPGQTLELEAQSSDLPSVRAVTTVPAPIPEVKLTHREVLTYKDNEPGQTMNSLVTLLEFHLLIDEKPDKDEYFGIQICRRTVYDTVGTVPGPVWKSYKDRSGIEEYDDLYADAGRGEGNAISSEKKEMFVLYDGGEMMVIPAEAEGEGAAVNAYVYPTKNRLVNASYGGKDNYEIYEVYEYNVRLYRLSPEMFRCLKARYIINNSRVPIHLGFSPVTYTFTNVKGGLGIFGAVSEYESGWFRIRGYEEKWNI